MNRIALTTLLTMSALVPVSASGAPVPMPSIAQGASISVVPDTIGVKMTGQKSGAIPKASDPQLSCARLNHSIVSPRDAQTGLATGKRQHSPMVCTTRGFSGATVLLYNVLDTNENLTSVLFSLSGKDAGTIKLTNASVASIEMHTDGAGLYFDIAFTYQKIEWTYAKGGVTSMDDWQSRP